MTKQDLSQECKVGLTHENQCAVNRTEDKDLAGSERWNAQCLGACFGGYGTQQMEVPQGTGRKSKELQQWMSLVQDQKANLWKLGVLFFFFSGCLPPVFIFQSLCLQLSLEVPGSALLWGTRGKGGISQDQSIRGRTTPVMVVMDLAEDPENRAGAFGSAPIPTK